MPECSHNLGNKNTVSRGSQIKTNITNDEGMCVCVYNKMKAIPKLLKTQK